MNSSHFLVKVDTSSSSCSSAYAGVNLVRRSGGRTVDPDNDE